MSSSEKKPEKLDFSIPDSMTASERAVTRLLDKTSEKKPPTITAMPRSALLDRVKQFLPQMEEANNKLTDTSDIAELDIEKLSQQHKDNYIEINLACADLEDERFGILRDLQDEEAKAGSSDSESENEQIKLSTDSKKKKNLISELS
ncbi:uncharacterized protein LOC132204743 [Neocloeon triangulifer]|uniref:uncharacterized protein LOC132204743 n=1 Tax=Neocloeon triangulifer TaxID=2078957 RepID=UPI00286EF9C6|nr:uncharacterized protein LOC132204743 [Neocloeon triangulifer]